MASFIGNLLEMQLGMEKKNRRIKLTKQKISLFASKSEEKEEEAVLVETIKRDKLKRE
jgi:hypothetical protein